MRGPARGAAGPEGWNFEPDSDLEAERIERLRNNQLQRMKKSADRRGEIAGADGDELAKGGREGGDERRRIREMDSIFVGLTG